MSKEKVARSSKQYFVVGLKEILKASKKNQVASLIIAEDAEAYLMTRVLSQVNQKNIPVSFFKNKHVLGKHMGTNVNTIIVALIK